ncbi:MAG TPA: DUF3025 domain-containing protein [Gammaproteobacteria bacterium]
MTTHSQPPWNPAFLTAHPGYWPLLPFAQAFVQSHDDWPTLDEYQQFLDSGAGRLHSGGGKVLRFIPQSVKPQGFEDSYEPRIYLRGEIQTRLRNWHDFFQVMLWRLFPKTKVLINELHYLASKQRLDNEPHNQQRSAMENALTQFDECGAVLVSSEPGLLDLVKNFQWKTLFWEHRNDVRRHLRCVVFGHALYEKALNPYVGMTAHSVLLPVTTQLVAEPALTLIPRVDDLLRERFRTRHAITSPGDFSPFPLLGMPCWDANNDQELYYDNLRYFRPGRQYKT